MKILNKHLSSSRFQGTGAQFAVLDFVMGFVAILIGSVHGDGFSVGLLIVRRVGTHPHQLLIGSARVHDNTNFLTLGAIGFLLAVQRKKKKFTNWINEPKIITYLKR